MLRRRTVSVLPTVVEAMREHLAAYVDDDPSALVFTGPKGGPVWRGNFRKLTAWTKPVTGLGFAGLHFHDVRHTGNPLAARSAVSTRDLMARMGHDSVRSAIIYQHATTKLTPGSRPPSKPSCRATMRTRRTTRLGRMRTRTVPMCSFPPVAGEHCGAVRGPLPDRAAVEPGRAPVGWPVTWVGPLVETIGIRTHGPLPANRANGGHRVCRAGRHRVSHGIKWPGPAGLCGPSVAQMSAVGRSTPLRLDGL